MGQHKNRAQVDIFIKFMEQHQDLARGFVKGDRVYCEQLWAELAMQLNASGPPSKDIPAWKKVWVDMKLSVKHRMAHNKAECGKTGGGRFNKYILSPTDEQVAIICGLYASVEGIKDAKSFGVPSNEKPTTSKNIAETVNGPPKSNTTSDTTATCYEVNVHTTSSPSSSPVQTCENEPIPITPSTSTRVSSRKRKRNIADVGDVMEMEAEHFSKISKNLDLMKSEIKENRTYLKEISRNIRDIKKLKEKELKELTRHNYALEKSAQVKNELKLKFLELERLKLGLE